MARPAERKGDYDGHPFRGNQYTNPAYTPEADILDRLRTEDIAAGVYMGMFDRQQPELVRVNDLISPQRDLNLDKVNRLAADFSMDQASELWVIRDERGKLQLIEGNTRLEAAKLAGFDELPAKVVNLADVQQRARKSLASRLETLAHDLETCHCHHEQKAWLPPSWRLLAARTKQQKTALQATRETTLRRLLEVEFRKVGKEVLAMTRAGAAAQTVRSRVLPAHRERLRALMRDAARKTGQLSWSLQYSLLQQPATRKSQSFLDRTLGYLENHALSQSDLVGTTTADDISRVLQAGEAGQLALEQMVSAIEDLTLGVLAGARASTIARTETHTAASVAEHEAVKDSGMQLRRVWLSTGDERTRGSHRRAFEQTSLNPVGMDEPFTLVSDDGQQVSQLRFPGDPSGPASEVINCRCVVMYVPL